MKKDRNFDVESNRWTDELFSRSDWPKMSARELAIRSFEAGYEARQEDLENKIEKRLAGIKRQYREAVLTLKAHYKDQHDEMLKKILETVDKAVKPAPVPVIERCLIDPQENQVMVYNHLR